MNVNVNGRTVTVPAGSTVAELLAHLGLGQRVAAVEVNGEAVVASERSIAVLHDGDHIELVRATAGG